jgi:hypothetical protein
MSSLVIAGDTSGTVTLQAPTTAGSTILTLPSTSGNIITSTGGVSPSTTGNVLTSDGTNWVSSGKLTYATAVPTTSGTTAVISSVPSWAKRITILFNGVTSASSSITMTFNSVTTGYTYTQSRLNASGTVTVQGSAATSFSLTQNAPTTSTGRYTISLANATTNYYVIDGNQQASTNINILTGFITLGALISSITITAGSAFSAGEIDVIYE